MAARPLFERALAIQEKVLGPEHPETAISRKNLALLFYGQDDLVAHPHTKDLARLRKVLGAGGAKP